jgi:hypothetical protein
MRRHPGLDVFGRRQDYRHRCRVDDADLGVRLRRQEDVTWRLLSVSGNASGETMVNSDNEISFIGTLRPDRQ